MTTSHITWDPKYSVTVEAIDNQHRKLFDITNQLLDVFESNAGDVLPIIKELVDYLSIHFHAEHLIMADSNYPGFPSHMQEHQKFTTRIEQFLEGYKEQNQELTSDMVVFLRDWLFDHTCGIDQEYGAYLRKQALKSQNTPGGLQPTRQKP